MLVKHVAVLLCALVSLATASRVTQASVTRDHVPANILKSTWVRSDVGTRAIVFKSGGLRLGIVSTHNGASALRWSESIPAEPAHLASPGPAGLIQGVIRLPNSARTMIFAYNVHNDRVLSAIAGRPSGKITGDDGARFNKLTFTVSAADTQHVGAVKYRIDSRYGWTGSVYAPDRRTHLPDYAANEFPRPSATFTAKGGNITLIRLEIAATLVEQETGLMNRTSLDPDSGMIFVWTAPVLDSFYMENTYIPLSIAFLAPDGKVQEIQNMDPLTLTLHTPVLPYQYAIEANLGFFTQSGISVGDTLALHLNP